MNEEQNAVLQTVGIAKTIPITERVEEYLQEQVEYLSKQVWGNLVWIASSVVCDYGVEPTFDQVKYEAFAIAEGPEHAVFDRELAERMEREVLTEPGNPENEVRVDTEQRATPVGPYGMKKGLSAKQYDSVMLNSEFVTKNLAVLGDLAKAGFISTTSQEDKFKVATIERRERMTNWRRTTERENQIMHEKNYQTGRKAADACSVL